MVTALAQNAEVFPSSQLLLISFSRSLSGISSQLSEFLM